MEEPHLPLGASIRGDVESFPGVPDGVVRVALGVEFRQDRCGGCGDSWRKGVHHELGGAVAGGTSDPRVDTPAWDRWFRGEECSRFVVLFAGGR
jgi:hypothetical protein